MLLRAIDYQRPASLDEAVVALGRGDNARVLAGGQSLVNVLKHRLSEVNLLVDVSRLEELRFIDARADGSVEIGAATTYDELDRSTDLRETHPLVANVAAGTVDQQVRCRGTIGGNACYNDPASNFPPLLVALEATMNIAGPDGRRSVAADDFFLGIFQTAVGHGELLSSITIPPVPGGAAYESLQLAEDSWALARACAVVALDDGGRIGSARVVLGCVASTPRRATAMEERLTGAEPTEEVVAAAAEAAADGISPPSDVHASGAYRRAMAAVMAKRAVLEAIATGGRK